MVFAEGIATDLGQVSAVESWLMCKCRQDVRSFLGMTGYYRRFIHQYAKIAALLFALTGAWKAWWERTHACLDGELPGGLRHIKV